MINNKEENMSNTKMSKFKIKFSHQNLIIPKINWIGFKTKFTVKFYQITMTQQSLNKRIKL